jgi:predicted nucleic acid-binding protein
MGDHSPDMGERMTDEGQSTTAAATAAPTETADTSGAPKGQQASEQGFPSDTRLADMTVEQQAAYWKHQARKHETAIKSLGDVNELRSKAEQYEALLRTTQTDQERAVEDARRTAAAEATAAARKQYGGLLVDAKITAATAGRLDDRQLSTLLSGLDRSRFLTATGEVNADALAEFVDGIAPAKPADLGQGRRGAAPAVNDMNSLIRHAAGR